MVPNWMRSAGVARQTVVTVALLGACIGACLAPQAVSAADVALKGDKTRTRFVIVLARDVQFQVFSLGNPNRVIVDLPDVKLQLPQLAAEPVGLVKSFRGGLAAPGKMRVVIDVTTPVIVESAAIDKRDPAAPRLVLEIVPVDGPRPVAKKPLVATGVAGVAGLGAASMVPPTPPATASTPAMPVTAVAAAMQPPLPKPAVRPSERAAKAFKPVIVLDPGHGGHDGGAVRNGAIEKEVVLAFALVLRERLEATGRYKVLLTRDSDKFIPLADRREFAENNKAALFIAVHADYASSSNARGATIYSLREGVANSLARSVKGERSADLLTSREAATVSDGAGDAGAVRSILADLAARDTQMTQARTGTFVRSVIEYMRAGTSMQNNPDRSAAFAVLRTAKVPAVLIELAYVSNQQDARNLKSDDWRRKVASTMVTAIDNYFSHQVARLPM